MSKIEKISIHGRRFLTDENGATAIEYALIVAILGVGIVASIQNLRTAVVDAINYVATAVAAA